MKTNKSFKGLYLGIIFAFIYIPVISMIVFSFNDTKSLTDFTGFSLKWYQRLFEDSPLLDAIIVSFIVAIVSTVVSTILGTLGALALSKTGKTLRNLSLQANNLPIINPEIVTAIALLIFFGVAQIERGYITMLLAHIAFSTPYVIVAVYPKIRSLDPNIAHASYDLGATPAQTLFKVILPQIKVAIIAGAAIAFTMSFDDFAISYFATSGAFIQNISTYLYTLKFGIEPTINALSTLIILVIGMKVIIDSIKNRKRKEED